MNVSAEALRTFATDVIGALDAPDEAARRVADVLVRADCRGYRTHGVGILPLYREMIADGAIDPAAEPVVAHGRGCTATVDGRGAFGQVTATEATAAGIAVAETEGAAVVGLRRGTHVGPLGEYARRAAAEGKVFLGFANTGGGAINTAPYGGHERKLSTNPVAFGIPTFDAVAFDVVVDVATSQVSGSVVREHHARDEPLEDAWTTTASGDPVEDPAAFMDGEGALLPLGGRATGHKGYGLAVVAELLAGIVGDNPVAGERDPEWFTNGAAFVVVDPKRFCDTADIEDRVTTLTNHLRDSEGEARLPGEDAHRRADRARTEGIAFAAADLAPLASLAADFGIDPPPALRNAFEDAADADGTDDVRTW